MSEVGDQGGMNEGLVRVPIQPGHRGIELPRGLEALAHLIDTDHVDWGEVEPGYKVHVAATDTATSEAGWFEVEVIDTHTLRNGLPRATLRLNSEGFAFALGDDRDPIVLPAGTVMENGVACTHFPQTVMSMVRLGAMDVGRDYDFTKVLLPDGEIYGDVYVEAIQELHPMLPDEGYEAPVEVVEHYRETLAARSEEHELLVQEAVRVLDEAIAVRVSELYDEQTVIELIRLLNTFHWSARYKLAIIMDWAHEDGKGGQFVPALNVAVEEGFNMLPEGMRGNDGLPIPGTQRGYTALQRELDWVYPRPEGSEDGSRYLTN